MSSSIRFCMLLFVFSLTVGLVLISVPAIGAESGCSVPYVVQSGDWLTDIARRNGITVAELMQLNPNLLYNPNLIYPGQVLCLPVSGKSAGRSLVALEINYQYTGESGENDFDLVARGGYIGKRVAYPLGKVDAIQTVSQTVMANEINKTLVSNHPPAFIGVRNSQDNSYILVSVQRPDIFNSLVLTDSKHITPTVQAITVKPGEDCPRALALDDIAAFGSPGKVKQISLTVAFEASNGLQFPFTVRNVQALGNADTLKNCYLDTKPDDLGFALYALDSTWKENSILMVLNEGVLGPPGGGWPLRCRSWAGGGGWFYRWISAWYGC